MAAEACPLCAADQCRFIHRSDDRHGIREFFECAECDLAFVPPRFHLSADAELERYLMHDNDIHDVGYRGFLSRLWNELKPSLRPASSGLDFGCGPGPALACMMREQGFAIELYDPFFFPNREALEARYDFITCTETAEHLRKPAETFALLDSLLADGGKLGVMTGMLDDRAAFAAWGYQRDPTHVAFYTRRAMRWIARRFGWRVEFPADNVTIFTKPKFAARLLDSDSSRNDGLAI